MAFQQVIMCEKRKQAEIFVKFLNLTSVHKINGTVAAYYNEQTGIACVHQSGHLLETMPPQFYEPNLAKNGWNLEDIPVIPDIKKWKLSIKHHNGKSQYAVSENKRIKNLFAGIKWAMVDQGTPNEIILAVDNDQEGELLGWEMIKYLGLIKHPNITRMLYSQLVEKAVKKAYVDRESGKKWFYRYLAGLARQYGDWLIGMNVTMALTVENKDMLPPKTPLNSGRVIFAISYILYARNKEIEEYVQQDIFNEVVTFKTKGNESYTGRVVYPEKYLDPKLKKQISPVMAAKINQYILDKKEGTVVKFEKSPKKKGPPKGFSRTALDVYISKKYGMSLKEISDALQKLYGDLALVTYPRVSVKQLDLKMHEEMPSYLAAMAKNLSQASQLSDKEKALYAKAFQLADNTKVSAIWGKNVDEDESHHCIIPTDGEGVLSKLTANEFIIYRELADRLLIQFLPDYEYLSTSVETKVGGFTCVSNGSSPLRKGWKGLTSDPDEESDGDDIIPLMELGDTVDVTDCETKKTSTTQPQLYTSPTLLLALENPAKFVENKAILKSIKKMEIGTDGTRPEHITALTTKQFVEEVEEKKGKSKKKPVIFLKPTQKLLKMMEILPGYLKHPETSAFWEDSFKSIQKGELSITEFTGKQVNLLHKFFDDLKTGTFKLKEPMFDNYHKCPENCDGFVYLRILKGKKFNLWCCSKCEAAFFDKEGQVGTKLGGKTSDKEEWTPPNDAPRESCPSCKKGKVYHRPNPGKSWTSWVCTGCSAKFFDENGKPGKKMGAYKNKKK